jgi:Holliday junction resolvase RusA-like endonuclease
MKEIFLPILPDTKPAQTQRDRWRPSKEVQKFRAFRDELAWRLSLAMNGEPFLPERFAIWFGLPMPRSWSAKEKARRWMTPHQVKPDLDKLIAGFFDGLRCPDQHVHTITGAGKFWDATGWILIQIPDGFGRNDSRLFNATRNREPGGENVEGFDLRPRFGKDSAGG